MITADRASKNQFFNQRRERDAYRPSCGIRSEEHTSELQSRLHLVCRLLPPPTSTLFPYTTLFRSELERPSGRGNSRGFLGERGLVSASQLGLHSLDPSQ